VSNIADASKFAIISDKNKLLSFDMLTNITDTSYYFLYAAYYMSKLATTFDKYFWLVDFDMVGTAGFPSIGLLELDAYDIYHSITYIGAGKRADLGFVSIDECDQQPASGDFIWNLIPNEYYPVQNRPGFNPSVSNSYSMFDYLAKTSPIRSFRNILTPANVSALSDNGVSMLNFMLAFRQQSLVGSHAYKIRMKEIALLGTKSIDTLGGDLFTRVKGELTGPTATDPNHTTDDVYHAIMHILEDYDGIPKGLIDYGTGTAGDMAVYRNGSPWNVARTLTDQKNSVDYLNELAAQSFVAMFSGRTGKRTLRAFENAGAVLAPSVTHDENIIVRDSISSYQKSDISQLYNSFYLQYNHDAGSSTYTRAFNVQKIDQAAFPDVTDVDANGTPLWWQYFGGLQQGGPLNPGIGYPEAMAIWNICHNSYLLNKVMHQVQGDMNQLPWFADSLVFDPTDSSSTGTTSSAYSLLFNLAQWVTRQKDGVSYAIPINQTTITSEIMDLINFKDIIYTNGNDKSGWITGLEIDVPNDQLKLTLTFQPDNIDDVALIVERGPALNSDTIEETGSQADTYTES
jgi:hypothetical protein